ncbi:MAG: peptide-methionine (S)-S-oxide reductase MsrA [Anaerovoracaceae bacterium]
MCHRTKQNQTRKGSSPGAKVIHLAGGCFWGLEKYLQLITGVLDTQVGYANGTTENPTYEDVCHRDTGHAETVRVEYDPLQVPLPYLLSLYFKAIDPVSRNRQGNDVGSQYRTGIYYVDSEDEFVAQSAVEKLQKDFRDPIAVEVVPLLNYYPAEEYHQDYLTKNPGGYCHIGPALFEMAKDSLVNPEDYVRPNPADLNGRLSEMQYRVAYENGTEPPYENEYWDAFSPGIYVDITTGEPLFGSRDKFEACGWPSFSNPIDSSVLTAHRDLGHGMIREEIRSRVGDIHLGHVFEDGPREKGGLRYCINSAALRFIPKEEMESQGYSKYLDFAE